MPGSTYGQATELYHEGLMLPPVRIHRAGVPDEDVFRLIAANTRAPYVVLGDISGQIGVTRIGRFVYLTDPQAMTSARRWKDGGCCRGCSGRAG